MSSRHLPPPSATEALRLELASSSRSGRDVSKSKRSSRTPTSRHARRRESSPSFRAHALLTIGARDSFFLAIHIRRGRRRAGTRDKLGGNSLELRMVSKPEQEAQGPPPQKKEECSMYLAPKTKRKYSLSHTHPEKRKRRRHSSPAPPAQTPQTPNPRKPSPRLRPGRARGAVGGHLTHGGLRRLHHELLLQRRVALLQQLRVVLLATSQRKRASARAKNPREPGRKNKKRSRGSLLSIFLGKKGNNVGETPGKKAAHPPKAQFG